MAGDKILVFGATGPAGICVLRELLHRKLPALAYCRNPSKIPQDLTSDPLLEVSISTKMLTCSAIADRR
jgi:putative NADH-flavin reductase